MADGNWFSNMFAQGGMLQTGQDLNTAPNQKKLDAGMNPDMVEKGSILGMTPSTFSSVAGQMGAAISPKGSWQEKLGTMASQMGSQKLGQLMQAEKEKRATDLYKQMLKAMSSKELAGIGGIAPTDTGIGGGFDFSKNRADFDQSMGANTPPVKSF